MQYVPSPRGDHPVRQVLLRHQKRVGSEIPKKVRLWFHANVLFEGIRLVTQGFIQNRERGGR